MTRGFNVLDLSRIRTRRLMRLRFTDGDLTHEGHVHGEPML